MSTSNFYAAAASYYRRATCCTVAAALLTLPSRLSIVLYLEFLFLLPFRHPIPALSQQSAI